MRPETLSSLESSEAVITRREIDGAIEDRVDWIEVEEYIVQSSVCTDGGPPDAVVERIL